MSIENPLGAVAPQEKEMPQEAGPEDETADAIFEDLARIFEEKIKNGEGLSAEEVAALYPRIQTGKELVAKLETDVLHDTLTGIDSLFSFQKAMERETALVKRQIKSKQETPPLPLCLFQIDLDFFKNVNDTHGHMAGDTYLRDIAASLKTGIRETDIFARVGGDEFRILMPEFNPHHAPQKAEELLELVRKGSSVASLSASIGFAVFRTDETSEEFIDRADQYLYKAKAAGRDRFVGEGDDPQ